MKVWLIGSGGMARDYFKVLRELGENITVIGRGESSALSFEEATGFSVERGGLDFYLKECSPELPDAAIVAVGIEMLATTVSTLLKLGVKKVLVEKPAGLYAKEIVDLENLTVSCGAEVYVAYNRRFYSSVRNGRKIISEDGGVQSFNFEFTEWGHEIENLTKAEGVKSQWVLGNSSHVIDLAFYLGGNPEELYACKAGGLSWHPAAAVFAGAGRTDSGALFSYQANWGAPGRWGLEICTRNYRLVYRPMENLQIIRKGSVAIEPCHSADEEIDKQFKPGLFLQTKYFLEAEGVSELCSISEHTAMLPTYTKIAGYN
jgi:predicted dehydrogenase